MFENLTVNGFEKVTCKIRSDSRGWGTVIFGKKLIKAEPIVTSFIEECIETTRVKIGEEISTLKICIDH